MDLDQSTTNTVTTQQHFTDATNADLSSAATIPNIPKIRLHLGIGIPRTRIYLVSLAERQDRREQMEPLRTIQDLTWTVVDAIPGNATLVNRIFDWVTLHRSENSKKPARRNFVGLTRSMRFQFRRTSPWRQSGSDTWAETSPSSKPEFSGKFRSSMYGETCVCDRRRFDSGVGQQHTRVDDTLSRFLARGGFCTTYVTHSLHIPGHSTRRMHGSSGVVA